MKIIASIVLRNEEKRFLKSFLEWHSNIFDYIYIFDDQSSDATVDICRQYTDLIDIRKNDEPSFSDHEGKFRQTAWNNMSKTCHLMKNDWVVSLDADEFFTAIKGKEKDTLSQLIDYGSHTKKLAIAIEKVEIWNTNPFQARVDGFWRRDKSIRLVKWRPKATFVNSKLGCGSIPEYGIQNYIHGIHIAHLLHCGYSIPGTAEKKYELYKNIDDNKHNPEHIKSLLTTPTLIDWNGKCPPM